MTVFDQKIFSLSQQILGTGSGSGSAKCQDPKSRRHCSRGHISDAYYSHPPRTRLCGEPGQRPYRLPPVCPRPRLPLRLVHQAGQELARGCCSPSPAAVAILISGGGEVARYFARRPPRDIRRKMWTCCESTQHALQFEGGLDEPPDDDG
jgi:hypothetical protein